MRTAFLPLARHCSSACSSIADGELVGNDGADGPRMKMSGESIRRAASSVRDQSLGGKSCAGGGPGSEEVMQSAIDVSV